MLIGAGFVVPFFMKGPNGKPVMTLADIMPAKPELNELSLEALTGSGDSHSVQQVYRYKDQYGNWQFSDQAPADGIAFEMVGVNRSINTIEAVEPAPRQEIASDIPGSGVAGYVDNMKDLVQDAENVQHLMDEREANLQKTLEQIND